MMVDEDLLEPAKGYPHLRERVLQAADKIFDGLVKETHSNLSLNDETCDKYYAKLEEIKKTEKSLGKKKGLRAFLIFLLFWTVIGMIFGFVGIARGWPLPLILSLTIAGPLLTVLFLFIIIKELNPAIKKFSEGIAKLQKEANELLAEAKAQMAPINERFDWNFAQHAISSAIPKLQLDDNFDVKKYKYLVDKYGLSENDDDNISTYFVQSGSILGNPFLLERDYIVRMIEKEYTGELTIHWTTTTHDKNGTHVENHSETLRASTYHPAPDYSYLTFLTYGNDAAPKLVFSREPTVKNALDEKAIAKQVKRDTKAAEKLVKKSAMDDDPHDLQLMGNNEFEVLWNALDRNNETEFRLLFTPLAQNNLLKLLKGGSPYGDDFTFYKDKKINTIVSNHDQNCDLYGDPRNFIGYDNRVMRKTFLDYVDAYFKAIFFDFAPLLSIPLYQQQKPAEYIYQKECATNVSVFEHESLANRFDPDLFKPENAITPSILKTQFVSKSGIYDRVSVTAHAYEGFPEVDYVKRMGGDGCSHTIAVHWTRYEPVSRVRYMEALNVDSSRYAINTAAKNGGFANAMKTLTDSDVYVYQRKLMAYVADNAPAMAAREALLSALGIETKKVLNPNSKEDQQTLLDLMKEEAKK